jgi:formate hydrogenlyase subunit 3/multisubunit Na+/H+ antiporter MnhD subunit
MPQIPIIVPLIVVGLVIGSILKSKSPKISRKKLASASLVAGLLNSIHAYLLYSLTPTRTAASFGGAATGAPPMGGLASTSEVAFVATSFLSAFLMILLVLGIAVAYVRIRRSEELDEAPEQTSEAEPTITPI